MTSSVERKQYDCSDEAERSFFSTASVAGHSDTGHQNEDGRGNSHTNNIILHLKDWNKEENLKQHKVLFVFRSSSSILFTGRFKNSHLGLWFLAVQRSDFQKDISCLVWVRCIHLVGTEKSLYPFCAKKTTTLSANQTRHNEHKKCKFLPVAAALSLSPPAEGASLQRGS